LQFKVSTKFTISSAIHNVLSKSDGPGIAWVSSDFHILCVVYELHFILKLTFEFEVPSQGII
jgi:hypothetical protein